MNFGHIFSNMFGGQPQGIVEGDEQPAHPSMGMPAAPMPWHPSKGQTIAGIIGDTLASVSGGQPVFTQNLMHARQLQQQAAAEEAQWGRHHATEQQDAVALLQYKRDHPEQSPVQRDAAAWQAMSEPEHAAYREFQAAKPQFIPDGLGGGQWAIPSVGGAPAAPTPGVTFTPLPPQGGTAPQATTPFPTGAPHRGR